MQRPVARRRCRTLNIPCGVLSRAPTHSSDVLRRRPYILCVKPKPTVHWGDAMLTLYTHPHSCATQHGPVANEKSACDMRTTSSYPPRVPACGPPVPAATRIPPASSCLWPTTRHALVPHAQCRSTHEANGIHTITIEHQRKVHDHIPPAPRAGRISPGARANSCRSKHALAPTRTLLQYISRKQETIQFHMNDDKCMTASHPYPYRARPPPVPVGTRNQLANSCAGSPLQSPKRTPPQYHCS